MHTVTRRLTFCAGHRVHAHESKCSNPHGHNYVAFIECTCDELDALGRVVDFSVIKERVGTWLDVNWDHGFIYWDQDPFSLAMVKAFAEVAGFKPKTYAMPMNPTAENMAELLHGLSSSLLRGTGCTVTKVTIQETENCVAAFT